MNEEEQRILHGLYYNREMVGEEKMYTANELKWLARNPFRKAKEWQNEDGKLKSVEDTVEGVSRVKPELLKPSALRQCNTRCCEVNS